MSFKRVSKGNYSCVMEVIKWLAVAVLLVLASVGNYIYRDCALLYRVAIIFFLIMVAGYLALLTRYGKFVIVFAREAHEEVRKVIWPTFRESVHTTLVVIMVTIVMSLVLWGLDSILMYVVSLSLRL